MIRASGAIARSATAAVEIEEVLIDGPGPGEVLVRVLASGVCHSDVHCAHGVFGMDYPYLLGHEAAGVVESLGAGVTTPGVGDYVVLAWQAPCGRCQQCSSGHLEHCVDPPHAGARLRTHDGRVATAGSTLGSFCSYAVVAAAQAVPVPREVPATSACLVGCAVATGVGAAVNTAAVRPRSSAVIFGCGGVGVNVIQGARIAGAERIVAVDVSDVKLELARRLGATDVVNARTDDVVDALRELSGGMGFDYSFEVAGRPDTLVAALGSLGVHGRCIIVGVPVPSLSIDVSIADLYWRAAGVQVSWYGDTLPSRDFPRLCAWYLEGKLKLDELVTRVVGLRDAPAALAAVGDERTIRTVINLAP